MINANPPCTAIENREDVNARLSANVDRIWNHRSWIMNQYKDDHGTVNYAAQSGLLQGILDGLLTTISVRCPGLFDEFMTAREDKMAMKENKNHD